MFLSLTLNTKDDKIVANYWILLNSLRYFHHLLQSWVTAIAKYQIKIKTFIYISNVRKSNCVFIKPEQNNKAIKKTDYTIQNLVFTIHIKPIRKNLLTG